MFLQNIVTFFDEMLERRAARRAFNELCRYMDRGGLDRIEYNHCVVTLDVLRSKMYKDWNVK